MPPKRKRLKEYNERIRQASSILSTISGDNTTPRNIRRAAMDALDVLTSSEYSLAVRTANAMSALDDISQDPNMPAYTRTRIWNVVSLLEIIKE